VLLNVIDNLIGMQLVYGASVYPLLEHTLLSKKTVNCMLYIFVSCCICVVLLWARWGGHDGIDA